MVVEAILPSYSAIETLDKGANTATLVFPPAPNPTRAGSILGTDDNGLAQRRWQDHVWRRFLARSSSACCFLWWECTDIEGGKAGAAAPYTAEQYVNAGATWNWELETCLPPATAGTTISRLLQLHVRK
ncbi:hypothetical protein PG985_011928 [Apiospora marii]|uniref:Uncharacterized protein n=1 Tax=Apiospora marii TaxID=335849 RepID=A0ABR1REV1_9PEZI